MCVCMCVFRDLGGALPQRSARKGQNPLLQRHAALPTPPCPHQELEQGEKTGDSEIVPTAVLQCAARGQAQRLWPNTGLSQSFWDRPWNLSFHKCPRRSAGQDLRGVPWVPCQGRITITPKEDRPLPTPSGRPVQAALV